MPNKDFHRPVGMIAGGGYSYVRGADLPAPQRVLETLGGIAGGAIGAWLPDAIDPPTTPRHRNIGHGAVNVAGALYLSNRSMRRLRQRLRHRADALARVRPFLNDDWSRLWNWIQECFLRFLVGALNGIPAGYVSHLFFDALTPNGINLFYRGR